MRQLLVPGSYGASSLPLDRALDVRLRRVLRLRAGATLRVADGEGGVSEAMLGDDALALGPWRRRPRPQSPALRLVVAPIKGERFEWLVEKAVELGVDAIVPVQTRHAVVRTGDDRDGRRRERWQATADAAFEQCGRRDRVVVAAPTTLARWIAASPGPTLVADERGGAPVARALGGVSAPAVSLVVGPEGGLADDERAALAAMGAVAVTLGEAVLRAETAALALIVRAAAALGR